MMTALAFGYLSVGEALVRRGARVDNMAAAARLGRLADAESRHRALALAAQHGHVDIVRLILDAGEDPGRYNPAGNHSHSTACIRPFSPAMLRLSDCWSSKERDWTSMTPFIRVGMYSVCPRWLGLPPRAHPTGELPFSSDDECLSLFITPRWN
jgi:hypothetical protein